MTSKEDNFSKKLASYGVGLYLKLAIISFPLSFIINRSFEQGVFPESLKTVTPVHENEDTHYL